MPSTPALKRVSGRDSNNEAVYPFIIALTVKCKASSPDNSLRRRTSLPSEPAGYAFSAQGTNGSPAASTKGATAARDRNTTAWPRNWSLRASAVMGFRCPGTGRLRKPIRIDCPPQLRISGLREQPAQTLIRKYGNRSGEACQNVAYCHDQLFCFSGGV